MGAMLGDDQRGWLGKVEHLAGAVSGAHGRRYRQPAGRARRRIMIDRPVRHGDLPQGVSFITFLPARRLVRRLAQTSDPRRFALPVARRRLTAVGTIPQAKTRVRSKAETRKQAVVNCKSRARSA